VEKVGVWSGCVPACVWLRLCSGVLEEEEKLDLVIFTNQRHSDCRLFLKVGAIERLG